MRPSLKDFTRSEFEATSIGRAVALCSVFQRDFPFKNSQAGYFHPYPAHEVAVLSHHPQKLASYFSIEGMSASQLNPITVIKITMSNAWPPGYRGLENLNPIGTNYDSIDLAFVVPYNESPDIVQMTHVNKFNCAAAIPQQAGPDADKFFAEADSIVSLINDGHLIDFISLKKHTRQWHEDRLTKNASWAEWAIDRAGVAPDTLKGAWIRTRHAISIPLSGCQRDTKYDIQTLTLS